MLTIEKIVPELKFSASRSSGPGGQHVNKVSTKVSLRWDLNSSQILSLDQKKIIQVKLKDRISKEGVLILHADSSKSQYRNKNEAILKLDQLLKEAFKEDKKRKPTKPSKSAKEKRLKDKQLASKKKELRRRNDWD